MPSERRSAGSNSAACSSRDVERATGRYLLGIHLLSSEPEERVSTGQLQADLDVTGASVTEMVEKLDEAGLADHEKYRGVRLTDPGTEIATRLAWRYCVVTNFFGAVLETDLGDAESYEISYTLPKAGVTSLRELIDHPCIDQCPETSQDYDGCLL